MKKPYCLDTRPLKNGKKVFSVKFRSPDGKYLSGKSTGETDQSAAEAWAIEQIAGMSGPAIGWYSHGLPDHYHSTGLTPLHRFYQSP